MIGCFRLASIALSSETVSGAADAASASVEHMGVNHGGAYVFVTQEFLHRTNIVAGGQQVRGERVPECVTGDALREARFTDRCL